MLRFRENKQLAQGHTARTGCGKNVDSGLGDLTTSVSCCLSCSRLPVLYPAPSLIRCHSLRSHPHQIRTENSFLSLLVPSQHPGSLISLHFPHLRGEFFLALPWWLLGAYRKKEAPLVLNKVGFIVTAPRVGKQAEAQRGSVRMPRPHS